jgi:hypothetical protein
MLFPASFYSSADTLFELCGCIYQERFALVPAWEVQVMVTFYWQF